MLRMVVVELKPPKATAVHVAVFYRVSLWLLVIALQHLAPEVDRRQVVGSAGVLAEVVVANRSGSHVCMAGSPSASSPMMNSW